MKVPGFLARQFYVVGSLRNTDSGFALEARNPLGDGTIVGVGRLAVDGRAIEAADVWALREGDPEAIRSSDVTTAHPIQVRQGDKVTLQVAGPALAPGEHRLEVELVELNLGALQLSVSDRLAG
ncbi:MAG: hypothetical protein H0X16_10295 [Chloroflexi bacterium]|nr:hypothetical protein [Chloroflexota bacterium]